jgi:hypothetical protein
MPENGQDHRVRLNDEELELIDTALSEAEHRQPDWYSGRPYRALANRLRWGHRGRRPRWIERR